MPHKTIKHYENQGHARAFNFCCYQKQPFLNRDQTRLWTIRAIERARKRHKFHIWAYVIMPNHVHLLIYPQDDAFSASKVLSTIKQSVSGMAIPFVKQNAPDFLEKMTRRWPDGKLTYHFWKRGPGFDRNLWQPEAIWNEIDYIHANPVNWGLCTFAEEWEWSSAREYADPGSGALSIDFDSLPLDPR